MVTLNNLWDCVHCPPPPGPSQQLSRCVFFREADMAATPPEGNLLSIPVIPPCAAFKLDSCRSGVPPPPPPRLQCYSANGLPLIAFVAGVIELGRRISEGAWGYMLHTKRARSTLQRSAASPSPASGRRGNPAQHNTVEIRHHLMQQQHKRALLQQSRSSAESI